MNKLICNFLGSKKLNLFLLIILFLLTFPVFAQNSKVYKEITIDGKKQYRWLEIFYTEEREYDSNGNMIHLKVSDSNFFNSLLNIEKSKLGIPHFIFEELKYSDEFLFEYDSNGNLIYVKDADDDEEWWFEYDSNGNLIYMKDADDDEEWWFEYDGNENIIYLKSSDGYCLWLEYEYTNDKKIKSCIAYSRINWSLY